MKIGLLFGSFNPVHIGHLAIANYMAEFTDLNEVWLVVSPHNPHKQKEQLENARVRLAQVRRALGKHRKIKVSDIEFALPRPSKTIVTLELLKKKYPQHRFSLIIGEDNLAGFHRWKNYEKILKEFRLFVYPRSGAGRKKLIGHRNVQVVKAPLLDISSTFIRNAIKKKKDVRYFLPF